MPGARRVTLRTGPSFALPFVKPCVVPERHTWGRGWRAPPQRVALSWALCELQLQDGVRGLGSNRDPY